jgi:glutamyl-Q tRNA(Asp) synthetase
MHCTSLNFKPYTAGAVHNIEMNQTTSYSKQLITPNTYIGRFAPSPTGPLHRGSLVAAMASYLDAKTSRTPDPKWLVRIEDVDLPRTVSGAADQILHALDAFGFEWHGPVLYQSERTDIYEEAIRQIAKKTPTALFKCVCSRTEQTGDVYDGKCRGNSINDEFKVASSIRLNVTNRIAWHDRSGLGFDEDLPTTCGDFVLKRRDGLWAYQLAVVVDDELQGVTDVVRGKDLIDSTARQIFLQQQLDYRLLNYWHVPLVLSDSGEKLSKQTGAKGLNLTAAVMELQEAWKYLSVQPIEATSVDDFWRQAFEKFERLPTPEE